MMEEAGDNFQKLHFLCYTAAPTFLRCVFRSFWKEMEGEEWEDSCGGRLQGIISTEGFLEGEGRRIQRDNVEAGNVNQWDLSLLVDILRFLRRRYPSVRVSCCDLSKLTYKNFETLKSTRNHVAHAGSREMDSETFKSRWEYMVDVLTSMGMDKGLLERPLEVKVPLDVKTERSKTAEECNARGNEKFRKGRFWDAVADYAAAIGSSDLPHDLLGTLHANRSIALLKCGHVEGAIGDAHSAVTLRPTWFKGYDLLGQAHQKTHQFFTAVCFYNMAISMGDAPSRTARCLEVCNAMVTMFQKCDGSDGKMMEQTHSTYTVTREFISRHESAFGGKGVDALLEGTSLELCHLGQRYYWGEDGCPVDYKKAAEYFAQAASMGDAEGLYNLGMMTRDGKGVEKNPLEGHGLLLQAAGKEPFLENIEGLGIQGPNFGAMKAAHSLGMTYQFGHRTSVNVDNAEALKWYSAAVEVGSGLSANNMAVIYDHGKDPEDSKKAIDYWKLSAYLGSVKAAENLADAFKRRGEFTNAQKWFHYALHKGSVTFEASSFKDVYVRDQSLEETFDPEGFQFQLEKNLNESTLSGPMDKIKKIWNIAVNVPELFGKLAREYSAGRTAAILEHRKRLSTSRAIVKHKRGSRIPPHPRDVPTAPPVDLVGLSEIFLKDMEESKEDAVYTGRVLKVSVIEDAVCVDPWVGLLVEDANGDVVRVFVSHYPQRNTTQEEIGYGTRLSLIHPHFKTMGDALRCVRIEDNHFIFQHPHLRNPHRCRYCGKAEGGKVKCKKCRRVTYCSELCLQKDAQDLCHSSVCFKSV